MLHDFFNVTIARPIPAPLSARMATASAEPGAAVDAGREGVFVSSQSLVSFAGASGVVAILRATAQYLGLGGGPWPALAAAAVVGSLIYLIHATDPQRPRPANVAARLIELGIALINTLLLFTSALGIAEIAQAR